MTHIPPPAEELRILDGELRQLDARRALLLARRAWLVGVLHSAPVPLPAPPRRPETTAPSVQNVLLVLGGILLTVAAIAFTLVSWGHLGITGRALVLAAVTLAALATPVALLRRGLRSTAESVAGLGLALTVLDAYALHEAALPGTNGTAYAALASAVLAGAWAAYGQGLGALLDRPDRAAARLPLRLPLPAALVAVQLPLLLWAIAAGAGPHTLTGALLTTAAFDTVVALRVSMRSVRLVAAVGAYGMGGWGVLAAGRLSLEATGPSAAARAAALLALAAVIALGTARRAPQVGLAVGTAVTGGLLLVAGLGGILRVSLPADWTVVGYLVCAVALLTVVRGPLPEPVRLGLAWASGSVQALAVVSALPPVAVALLGPAGWAGRIWSGAPSDIRAAVAVGMPWPPATAATAPLLLAVVAGVSLWALRTTQWRPQAVTGALVLGWATALVLPATLELPYTIGLLALGLTAATAVAVAAYARRTLTSYTAIALALITSVSLDFLSLTSRPTTLGVLAALTALFAVAAVKVRPASVCASTSLAHATALACAAGAAAGWAPAHIALLVLVVPCGAALLAARLDEPGTTAAVEVTGAVAGLVAIGLAVTDPPLLALVLALCGVIAAGTAVRADRRSAGYAAAALFVLATWVRLGSWGVVAPEAYTLPVTVPALLVGVLRRRRDPLASSWTAYGPGLAATLVPSLLTAWGDAHWPRPLLLGAAALLATLLGARHRLRAPLLLGGAVLALDALHELAPYLVQLAGVLPRWLPPALAGLVLLAVGATYEQRIRDARRVREVLGRMY
ncbi:SCO7613 C-terminal domain-containing membrane protein [Streptomyces avermitilis]|uniref:SCO7613 C-terminal domain-containing membrane protein n=1 Tax=Streptomyces avermitilis TaxID=33903 RepID=UPI003820E314